MPMSALNFFWLTDPQDLQGIPPHLRTQNIITRVTHHST
jgi:hypothetical protein